MQTFKAETLISPANTEIKLKEWKIKENSKLSLGSVIFTYEYQSDGLDPRLFKALFKEAKFLKI